MRHHTKDLGDLGMFKSQLDLFEKGFVVSLPMTEHAPFDLIIWKDGVCKTVQVKARKVNKRGRVEINFRSSYCNSRGSVDKPVNKEHIDLYCVYCPDTDKCYYFDPKEFNKSVSFRVYPTKNGQTIGVRMIDDYSQLAL